MQSDSNENTEIDLLVQMDQDTEKCVMPVSFSQQRLWLLDRLTSGSAQYNMRRVLRLRGNLDQDALLHGLNEIVRRHEVLRTTFSEQDGRPVQVIHSRITLEMPTIDLCGIPTQDAKARRLVQEEIQQPFDLACGPLLRLLMVKLGEGDHLMVMTLHHIISDGWSMGVLDRELTVLYEAFSHGKESPLPELAIQYADYAQWQREWMQGEVLEQQLMYWRKQLADVPALDLPTDHPHPAVQGTNGVSQRVQVSSALTAELNALCQRNGVTLFMVLLAAFQVLLYRYSQQDDIVVGSPIAGRNQPEIESLIGFFVNTLVMRTDLSGDPTFREVLGRVREICLGAYKHQDVPFEKLVEELKPERDPSRNPIFQVMFVFQNTPDTSLRLTGLDVQPVNLITESSRFDLTMESVLKAGKLEIGLNYNTDIFDEQTIIHMLGHYQVLLEGIVANSDQHITSLPILTESESQQLLVEWNDTVTDYRTDDCIQNLFEAQVERSPNAVALVYEGQQLTYSELNARANQLAHYLQQQGACTDALVGICVERSLEMVIGILGIIKSGAAYVPLDPALPIQRLSYMLDDSKASLLVTQQSLVAKFSDSSRHIFCLDKDWHSILTESKENPGVQAYAHNIAYVIYTSGSLGKPKGVMIEHRSALNLARWMQDVFYVYEDKSMRVGLNAPIAFDPSVSQLLALLYGHTIYVLPQDVRNNPEQLSVYLREQRIDVLDVVPAQLKCLLESGFFSEAGWVPSVFFSGGDVIDEASWRLLGELNNTRIYNVYGPTEATVFCTACLINNQILKPTIGRPIANTQLYILDRNLLPVPVGVSGELHIGGAGLGRGYLNRAELTTEKFIRHPFSADPESLLYKTGDRARYLVDGNIEFMGRLDHQVKIRGYRIELGEIEAVLSQHTAIREVVVIAREDSPGDKRLVAYIVSNREQFPGIESLRTFLKQKLPDYMVPSVFVPLDLLPLNSNGKIDIKALPIPDLIRPGPDKSYRAPSTAMEKRLALLWAEVLKIDRVGVQDNFFNLGGHSLLATQLIARINKELQMEVPLRVIFEFPTIASQAAVLDKPDNKISASSGPAITARSRDKYRQ